MFLSMFLINIFMPLIMIYKVSDYRISLNNIYTSVFMSSAMMLVMNINYFFIIILITSYFAIRNQWFINEKQFIQDMIPHHSMALLTSSRLLSKKEIQNQNIETLAQNIYHSQNKEIEFMKTL